MRTENIREEREMQVTDCTFLPYTPVNGEANEHVLTYHNATQMKRCPSQDFALRVIPRLQLTCTSQ